MSSESESTIMSYPSIHITTLYEVFRYLQQVSWMSADKCLLSLDNKQINDFARSSIVATISPITDFEKLALS